ncbi:hypothetical protein [Shewanella sp. S23-S33]|uniref:hypothetical protein n=1 Tax=Shewanella TaxID=22 RepID=UPI00372D269C
MAKSKVVQVPCEAILYEKISAYRNTNKISSDASAMRQLALVGLRSLEGESVKGKPSDRELLESILFHVTKNDGDIVVSLD